MPDLPPVEETWIANVGPYIAAMDDLIAKTEEAAAAVEGLQERINGLDGKIVTIAVKTVGDGDVGGLAGSVDPVIAAYERLGEAEEVVGAGEALMDRALSDTASAAEDTHMALDTLTVTTTEVGAAATRAWTPWWTFGNNFRTVAHWIVAGSAEFLAVAVPAAVALGEGLLVASQGATNAYNHMTALWTAAESMGGAFHTTMGEALGLKDTLQQAQNAANPGVYELLGSGINDLKISFGGLAQQGLDVVHMFDRFAAEVTLDLKGAFGSEAQGLLSGMVADLEGLGQVLGNVGHFIVNLASDMPGLVHVLLAGLDAFTKLLEILTAPAWYNFGGHLITIMIGLEEFYRWGGLLLNILVRLTGQMAAMQALGEGGFIFKFGAALETLVSAGGRALIWAGTMIGRLAGVSEAFGTLGTATAEAGGAMASFAEGAGPLAMAGIAGGVALVTAGIGYLIYKLDTAKSATQQWVAASSQIVAKASDMNVLPTIYGQMADTMAHAATTQVLYNKTLGEGKLAAGMNAAAMQYNSQNAGALAQHLTSLSQTAGTVMDNTRNLAAALHISLPAAMEASQQAGVNLQDSMAKGGHAFQVAEQQIRNLITGLRAMSAPAGVVGNDMEALGIQSQLAGTKVSQLNQAWDAWIQSATAGASDMSQVQETLLGMSHAALDTSVSVSGSIGDIKRAADGTSYSLQGMGQKAMQSWQQFTSAIGTGEQSIDTLRTGMAEGVVSSQQFGSTIRGLVGEMLPFTQGNRNAVEMLSQLAHEAGGPITANLKTLAQWAGVVGKTAQDQFVKGMLDANGAMGEMARVASNLSAVMSTDLTSMFSDAAIKASGLSTALTNLANALANPQTPASTLSNDINNVITSMLRTGQTIPTITADLDSLGLHLDQAQVKAIIAAGHLNTLAASEGNAGRAAAANISPIDALAAAISGLHGKTIDITTYYHTVGVASEGGHTGTGPAGPAGASGFLSATPGLHLVGEAGPELVMFGGGERLLSNPETQRFLSSPGGGGGGGTATTLQADSHIHSHVYLDGEEIFQSTKTHTAIYDVRNGLPQQGRMAPG